jgi:hypothetical protein
MTSFLSIAAWALCCAVVDLDWPLWYGLETMPQPLRRATDGEKKTGMAEHLLVFGHAGLLVNGPPGTAELPFA